MNNSNSDCKEAVTEDLDFTIFEDAELLTRDIFYVDNNELLLKVKHNLPDGLYRIEDKSLTEGSYLVGKMIIDDCMWDLTTFSITSHSDIRNMRCSISDIYFEVEEATLISCMWQFVLEFDCNMSAESSALDILTIDSCFYDQLKTIELSNKSTDDSSSTIEGKNLHYYKRYGLCYENFDRESTSIMASLGPVYFAMGIVELGSTPSDVPFLEALNNITHKQLSDDCKS